MVLAAGTLNTVELLLGCRDEFRLLPKLSVALGTHFSGNGDLLCGALNTREHLAPWHGPVITTALTSPDDRDHFYLQEGGFTTDISFIVAAMRPSKGYLDKLLGTQLSNAARLRAFYQEMARLARDQEEFEARLPGNDMIFLGMGEDASDGRVTLRRRLGRRPKLVVEWDNARTQPLFDRMEAEFRRIAAELGGTYVRSPFYSFLGRQITVHPLGGAALSDSPVEGVINPQGEVWHYRGLYVADGAAIPRALRDLTGLVRISLADLDGVGDLEARIAALAARTERGAEYRETLELARLLGRLTRTGESGRQFALGLIGMIVGYLEARAGDREAWMVRG